MKKNVIAKIVIALTLTVSLAGVSWAAELAGIVAPRASKTFTARFYAGERITVGVIGDGSTDLDLYVYDVRGNEIAKCTGSSDMEEMTLKIYRSETFTIKVVNRGYDYNEFVVYTD
jgi:hypothetical protein